MDEMEPRRLNESMYVGHFVFWNNYFSKRYKVWGFASPLKLKDSKRGEKLPIFRTIKTTYLESLSIFT